MEHITREEFMDSQQRLHQRVDDITKASANIDKSVGIILNSINSIENACNKTHEVLFGNGKPGMITRLANAFVHIKLQYALVFLCVSGIIGAAIFIVRNNFLG